MPPRFGRPPGFGGAFDTPSRGEFQPGTEEGVIDPNLNRFTSKGFSPGMTTRSIVSGVSMVGQSTTSAASMSGRSVVSAVGMDPC